MKKFKVTARTNNAFIRINPITCFVEADSKEHAINLVLEELTNPVDYVIQVSSCRNRKKKEVAGA